MPLPSATQYRLDTPGAYNTYSLQTNAVFYLSGTGNGVGLYVSSNVAVETYGRNETVALIGDSNMTVYDNGQGTWLSIFLGPGATITVRDFQNDLTGKVHLMNQNPTNYTLTSDHAGGTILTTAIGGKVDFVDAHVTKAQIA